MNEMNKTQIITWHYFMDIHDPESVWYSDHKVMSENLSCVGLYGGIKIVDQVIGMKKNGCE